MSLAFWRRRPRSPFSPETPLVHWAPRDPWTLRDAYEGTLVVGATGSGKTSASINAIARALLRQGAGGVFTTTKVDDTVSYERMVVEEGRRAALVPFGPDWPARFNILDYEMNRPGAGAGHPDNIAHLLFKLVEMAYDSGRQGQGSDPYWAMKSLDLVRHSVWLLWLAGEGVSFLRLYLLITSAPRGSRDLRSKSWRERSYFWKVFTAARVRSQHGPHAADLELSEEFWLLEHAGLASRTRSIIVSVATGALSPFLRDPLRTLFSTTSTICPEMAAEGAVFLLDLPVKLWNEAGRMGQALFKFCFQRAIERRPPERSARPVFLCIDEYQHFATESDIAFAATARSSSVCFVVATQNLPILYSAFGKLGSDGKHLTQALLGNLSTKIFHAQTDPETNLYASDLCGKVRKRFANGSVTLEPRPIFEIFSPQPPVTIGSSEQLVHDVEPHLFAQQPKGGPANKGLVGGLLYQNGREFSNGRAWLPLVIPQGTHR